MTTIKVQTQISLETLLESLQQLNLQELELVEEKTALLRAQQTNRNLSQTEAELLLKINQGMVPAVIRERCARLTKKSRQGVLTEAEETELAELVDQIELLNAERMGYVAKLAKLRDQAIDALMQSLELDPLSYE